jgi:hypothetical protein
MLRGQDARPWYQIQNQLYLICTQHGIDIEKYPAIKRYLESHRAALEPKPPNWDSKKNGKWQGRSGGTYKWYEWISPVAYFEEFSKPKIIWSDISKLPRFSWDSTGQLYSNTVYGMGNATLPLLALLQSRSVWFFISQLATPLRLRGGLWQYRLFKQYIERLPIPDLTAQQETDLAAIAEEITALSRSRYAVHEDMRADISATFAGGEEISTRISLYRWWELDGVDGLQDEVRNRYKAKIKQRGEWEKKLTAGVAEHQRLTDEIIALEVRLNDIVYDAFNLTPEERRLIEETTKYPYGAV